MSERRRLLYLSTLVLVMLDTLRHAFSHGSRFLDISMWIMEFLVVILIAYEVGTTVWHKRKMRRRLARLFALLASGQNLQKAAPFRHDDAYTKNWIVDVGKWIREATESLDGYSHQAATAFSQVKKSHPHQPGINSVAGETYGDLLQYLENLRGIMEKPDVYY